MKSVFESDILISRSNSVLKGYLPTLRRTISDVGNYEFSFSQISGVLEKGEYSKRRIIIL